MNPAIWESEYEILTDYGQHCNVWLLMRKQDKKIFMGKCLKVYNRQVFSMLMGVQHPHIPRILSIWEEGQQLCVVEEYIAGETLTERLERSGRMTEAETVEVAIQICDALGFLHNRQPAVIHRDLKPSNIMISNDNVVKLIDYDAARCFEAGASRDTVLIGTSGYAAPEQFGFAQTDARTDIYALGVVMKCLLGGSHEAEPDCSPQMKQIIERCTHIDPDKRYGSAMEMRAALEVQKPGPSETDEGEEVIESRSEVMDDDESRREMKNDTENQEAAGAEEAEWRPFWPIPGFRKGKFWHMLCAMLGYLFIFWFSYDLEFASSKGDAVLQVLDRISVVLWLFFLVAMLTNYGGIGKRLPLVRKEIWFMRLLGYVIWTAVSFVIAAVLPGMVRPLIFW